MKNKLNDIYEKWSEDRSEENLNELMSTVRKRIVFRFINIEPNLYEDIAQKSLEVIWRSLPGYAGPERLKSFRPNRVSFAVFCAQVARGSRKDMLKHERMTATKDEELVRLINDQSEQEKGY
jgi:hypothetical protein